MYVCVCVCVLCVCVCVYYMYTHTHTQQHADIGKASSLAKACARCNMCRTCAGIPAHELEVHIIQVLSIVTSYSKHTLYLGADFWDFFMGILVHELEAIEIDALPFAFDYELFEPGEWQVCVCVCVCVYIYMYVYYIYVYIYSVCVCTNTHIHICRIGRRSWIRRSCSVLGKSW